MTSNKAWRAGAVFVMLGFFALLGWVALDLLQSRERELQVAEQQGSTLARLLESHFQATSRQVDHHLSDFVRGFQNDVADRLPRERIDPILRLYLERFPELYSFRVVDAKGHYVYDAAGLQTDASVADRDYFIHLRDNPSAGLVISEPVVSRATGEIGIVFARRLQDRQGQFGGVVFAVLRADYYERYYQGLAVGQQGIIALWSRDMKLFARWPRLAVGQGRRVETSPIPARVAAGELEGSFRREGELDGRSRVFVYRAVQGYPFVITVGFDQHEVLLEWQRRATIYGVLGVVLLAALLALMMSWSRGYRRAEQLATQMSQAYAEKALEARALLDSIPDPAWLLDNDGRFVAVNEAFCRYRGRPMDQIVGHTVEALFPPDEARNLREGQVEAYRKGAPVRQIVRLQLDGRLRPLEFLRVPVYGEDGEIRGLTGVAWDLSERFEAEERQRLITHFFDHASDAVMILDAAFRVLTVNKAVTEASGYALEDFKDCTPCALIEGGQDPAWLEGMRQILSLQGRWQGELQVRCKDGRLLPVDCSISAIHDDRGEVINWSVFVIDLSDSKAVEARIDALIHFDQLTGLPNRQGFGRLVEQWLQAGRTGVLAVFQLDDQLGRINDAFGHAAGDAVLRRLAARLNRALGEGNILARLGNDQFGVLLDQGGLIKTEDVVVRHLLDSIAKPVGIEGSDVVLTACAGICVLGEDGREMATLLRNADAALRHARGAGQNCVRFFAADMNERMAERLRIESDLRGALGRGELELHYQPQVDLLSGEIVGFESLLRWHHPDLGKVSPAVFVPVAEESRLILPIGAWVLEEACRQNKAWQDAGMAPRVVAVNLSALQFHGADVVDIVDTALKATGLAPRYLELEITESVIVEDPERVVRLMQALKALGVGLSIDDFGTGYSSLSYLKRFPIDKIKIDRAFVRDVDHNANDAAIVRMVIGIAAELELKVVAEGVETVEQLKFLRRHGCDVYQGFLCSPAVAANEVPALLVRSLG